MRLPTASSEGPIGAYGLRLEGVETSRSLLVPAKPRWPTFHIRSEVHEPPWRDSDIVTDSDADLRLQTGGEIRIEREPGLAVFRMQRPLKESELIHPYLAPVAAVAGYWFDRESFHAGAFVLGGGAWGVIGGREAGKSTLLASLASRGIAVLSDDMLILDGDIPFQAPRSIDLRPAAAKHFSVGEPLGVVGARERWRLRLAPIVESLPLRGWIFLSWGDHVETSTVAAHERIARLGAQRGLRMAPRDPVRLLDLAALPAWELRRPRAWDGLDAATDLLLERIMSTA
jgi:hypothetical protein